MSFSPSQNQQYFWHNIGMRSDGWSAALSPSEKNQWWRDLIRNGEISAGFVHKGLRVGEELLKQYKRGAIIIAYASGHGAVGWGTVYDPQYVRISHQHHPHRLRGIAWKDCAQRIEDALPSATIKERLGISHPPRTKFAIRDGEKAKRLIQALATKFDNDFEVDAHSRLYPDEVEVDQTYLEGARREVRVNAYERDPRARSACLKHHGYRCAVCGLLFEERYGKIGRDFIHVHHLKPLALSEGPYQLNPTKDLRPVCPNCHAMLHHQKQILSIMELKMIIQNVST